MFEREDNTERFFIPAHGPDDDALRAGLAWLRTYAEGHLFLDAAIWVPTKDSVENLGRVIGRDAAAHLKRTGKVKAGAITISLLSERTTRSAHKRGPVLAVWVDDRQLDKLDALDAPALCAIPWSETDIDGWKRSWNPTDARTGVSAAAETTATNPVLEAALGDLTTCVNLSTGVTHPSDKAMAVQLFQLLKSAHEPFDPLEVKALAVRRGWEPRHATALADIAKRIAEGKVVQTRGAGKMWRADIIEQWRTKSEISH